MIEREIYLDGAATTPPLPAVIDAMTDTMFIQWGNASSQHARGRAARDGLERAREHVASFLHAAPWEVVFTSGATEGNDAVLRWAHEHADLRLVTTSAEHTSLQGVFRSSPERVSIIPLHDDGTLCLDRLAEAAHDPRPALFAIGLANGETGVLQPAEEMRTLVVHPEHRLLIDATQAVGRVPHEHLQNLAADYLTASAHKMNGPPGVGCIAMRASAPPLPLASGGGQEEGRRSGTENLPGVVGFGEACRVRALTLDEDLRRMCVLRDRLEAQLVESIPSIRINGKEASRTATTSSLTIPGLDGAALVARLDARGLRCSQVSACSSARPAPSATLLAMGRSEEDAFASIRLALTIFTDEADIDEAAELIAQEVALLSRVLGVPA